jgi:hypothetical protein
MFDVLSIAYRIIALIGGSLFLYAAIFLYEDEQGRIQNILEDLWVKIDDRQRVSLSRHAMFVQVLTQFMSQGLNRMFGKRLLSVRSVGVSICYSFASFYLFWLAVFFFKFGRGSQTSDRAFSDFLLICILPLGIYLLLGVLSTFIRGRVSLKLWFLVVVLFGFIAPAIELLVISAIDNYRHFSRSDLISISWGTSIARYMGIAAGVLIDVAFIAMFRWLLRWASGLDSYYKAISVLVLNIAIAFLLFIFPLIFGVDIYATPLAFVVFTIAPYVPDIHVLEKLPNPAPAAVVLYFLSSNLIIAMLTSACVLLALAMLIHRLFWPFVDRSVYSLQRVGIARRTKLLGSLGISLIGTGAGAFPAWLKTILNHFF